MFRRQNKEQNKNGKRPDNGIRGELEAENALNIIGNEAANGLDDFPNLNSNEGNNAIADLDGSLLHYSENDINSLILNDGSGKKQKAIPKEIVDEGLENYYENDLNNLTLKKTTEVTKVKSKRKNKDKKPNLINKPIYEGMSEKDPPDNIDNIIEDREPLKLIEPLIQKGPIGLIDQINEKNNAGSGKKGSKSAKKSKKPSASRAAAPRRRDEDLTQTDESLEPVQGWDFVAQRFRPRKKQGFLSKLGSWAAYYSGKTIGKIFGIGATILKSLWGLFTPGPGTLGGTFKRMRGSSRFQEKRDSDIIPGWDGAQFEDMPENEDQVNVDYRRVPEIWSWPTAEKPVEGNLEERNAKPRDPVISVYIQQGSPNYTVSKDGSTGHSGIGIEYSRYSTLAGRWQRYNVRFGYYMAGGGASLTNRLAVTSYNNATIPGKVMDEKGKQYDISRSFPAKPKQVNAVLRAAENYASEGGYNAYTRNCTTFAKDMIVNVANIKGAESAFAKDEVYLHSKADAKILLAGALAPIVKADMENGFEKMRNKKDLSYQNFGNKMITREDHERYRNSLKLFSWRSTTADAPNAVAENLKRLEGGKSGTIGMFDSVEENNKILNDVPITTVFRQVIPLFNDLKATMSEITPMNQLIDAGMTDELKQLMKDLNGQTISMKLIGLLPFQDDKLMRQKAKQSNLMAARTEMTDTIKKLNILLFRYYRNDKRIQKKVLPIISLLNHGINAVDDAFLKTSEKDMNTYDSDLDNVANNFSHGKYSFTYNGKTVSMSPSEYEAWLQIYKTPQKALEQCSRYQELRQKYKNKTITDKETKELNKLSRIDDLATEFLRSHRYMLEKDEFSQQDVDYAFSLEKKERQEGVESDMFEQDWNDPTMANMKNPSASASGTYQLLIMKTVFGGMKDRFKEKFGDKYDMKTMLDWLNTDAADCIQNHQKEMKTILRGLKHTTDKPDSAKLKAGFKQLMTKWMFRLFHDEKDKNQYRMMIKTLTSPLGAVMKETDEIITEVMNER